MGGTSKKAGILISVQFLVLFPPSQWVAVNIICTHRWDIAMPFCCSVAGVFIRQFRHKRRPSGKSYVGMVVHICNSAQHQGKQEFEVIWATRETWSPKRKSNKPNNHHKTPNPKPTKSSQKKFLKVEEKQEEDEKGHASSLNHPKAHSE